MTDFPLGADASNVHLIVSEEKESTDASENSDGKDVEVVLLQLRPPMA